MVAASPALVGFEAFSSLAICWTLLAVVALFFLSNAYAFVVPLKRAKAPQPSPQLPSPSARPLQQKAAAEKAAR